MKSMSRRCVEGQDPDLVLQEPSHSYKSTGRDGICMVHRELLCNQGIKRTEKADKCVKRRFHTKNSDYSIGRDSRTPTLPFDC